MALNYCFNRAQYCGNLTYNMYLWESLQADNVCATWLIVTLILMNKRTNFFGV